MKNLKLLKAKKGEFPPQMEGKKPPFVVIFNFFEVFN